MQSALNGRVNQFPIDRRVRLRYVSSRSGNPSEPKQSIRHDIGRVLCFFVLWGRKP
jgi:hypothetical protein